jgi:hypothetical protein
MMVLRNSKGETIEPPVPHISLFCADSAVTDSEFESYGTSTDYWRPIDLCAERGSTIEAEADGMHDFIGDAPWTCHDLEGVSNPYVRLMYEMAQTMYPVVGGMHKLHWNDLMSTVALSKPTIEDLKNEVPRVRNGTTAFVPPH